MRCKRCGFAFRGYRCPKCGWYAGRYSKEDWRRLRAVSDEYDKGKRRYFV